MDVYCCIQFAQLYEIVSSLWVYLLWNFKGRFTPGSIKRDDRMTMKTSIHCIIVILHNIIDKYHVKFQKEGWNIRDSNPY